MKELALMKVTKKLLAILLGLTLVFSMGISLGAAAAEPASTNLLTNPSFEDGRTGWTIKRTINTKGWDELTNLTSTEGGVFAYGEDTLTAPTEKGEGFGDNYLEITRSSSKSLLLQKVGGLKGGSAYQFSGWAYCEHTDGLSSGAVYVVCSYYNGDTLLNTLTRDASAYETDVKAAEATTASAWTYLRTVVDLPEGADGVEIGIMTTTRDESTRRYDNFSLTKYTNLLRNGDFEDVSSTTDAADWSETKASANRLYVGTASAHGGDAAFGGDTSYPIVAQFVKAESSTQYKLTYWIKATTKATNTADNKVRPRVKIWFYEDEYSSSTTTPGTNTGNMTFECAPQRYGTEWRQIVVYFTTEVATKALAVELYGGCKTDGNSNGDGGAFVIDDVELHRAEAEVELLPFSEIEPLKYHSYYNSGYTAVENAVNKAWTLEPLAVVTNSNAVYASAVAPKTANAMLMYGLYSTDESGYRVLKSVKLASPDANGMLSASMDVPAEGTYTLEAFVLENLAELSPMADKIVLQ